MTVCLSSDKGPARMSAIKGDLGGIGKIWKKSPGREPGTGQSACAVLAGKQLPVVAGDLVKGVSKPAGSTTNSLSQVVLDHKTDQFH